VKRPERSAKFFRAQSRDAAHAVIPRTPRLRGSYTAAPLGMLVAFPAKVGRAEKVYDVVLI